MTNLSTAPQEAKGSAITKKRPETTYSPQYVIMTCFCWECISLTGCCQKIFSISEFGIPLPLSAYVDVNAYEPEKYLPTCIAASKTNDSLCLKKGRREQWARRVRSCYSTNRFRINCRPISDQIIRLDSLQALEQQTVSVSNFIHRRLKVQKVCEEFPKIYDIPVARKRKKRKSSSKKIKSDPTYSFSW